MDLIIWILVGIRYIGKECYSRKRLVPGETQGGEPQSKWKSPGILHTFLLASRPWSQLQETTIPEKEICPHQESQPPFFLCVSPLYHWVSRRCHTRLPGASASVAVLTYTIIPITSFFYFYIFLLSIPQPQASGLSRVLYVPVISTSLWVSNYPILSLFLDSPDAISRACFFYCPPKDFIVKTEDSVRLETDEMAQKVKVPAWGSEFDSLRPTW